MCRPFCERRDRDAPSLVIFGAERVDLEKRLTAWASWADYRREEHAVAKLPSGGEFKGALFFPSDYSVGMANLGYHYIYRSLKELGIAIERFFLSPIPYRSVEGDTLFERFSLFLGSIAYEGDVPLFARWLAKGGVNPSRTRRDFEGAPIVGAGGAITYINPLSLSGIADFIVLGDGLPVIPFFVDLLRKGLSRKRLLMGLAEHPSILVPAIHVDEKNASFTMKLSKQSDLSKEYGHATWVTSKTVFGKTLLVELQRGCCRGCRYCTLPSCFGPFRQRPVALVEKEIREIASAVDFDQVGLITPEAGDYRGLERLLATIDGLEKGVSFASLRVDGLTKEIVSYLVRKGRRSITVAPESGDDALRFSCGKNFTNERIVEVLSMAKEANVKFAKLYFMIGLPGERDEHIESIFRLCREIVSATNMKLVASVSPFVPKPFTAWRNKPFAGVGELKRKYTLLSRAFRGFSKAELQSVSVREAHMEFALSWATSGVSRQLADCVASGGSTKEIITNIDRAKTVTELACLGLAC